MGKLSRIHIYIIKINQQTNSRFKQMSNYWFHGLSKYLRCASQTDRQEYVLV